MNTETHTALDPVTGPLVCMRQLASDGLPAVPSDPSGRHMSWVLVLDSAATHYRGELRKWNLASIVAAFGSYTAGGYEPPVLAEHDPASPAASASATWLSCGCTTAVSLASCGG